MAKYNLSKEKRQAIDLSKYVKGTPLYARAVQMKYGLPSARDIRIKEQKALSRAIKQLDKNNPIEYFNKFVALVNQKNINIANTEKRQKEINSGLWVEHKEITFKDNYINALEANKIDSKIIDAVKDLSAYEIQFSLPEITQYYIPNEKHRKKNGRDYHLDTSIIDEDSEEDRILDRLKNVMTSEEFDTLYQNVMAGRKKEDNGNAK